MKIPEKEVVIADQAPKPIGPYSVGIRAGHFVFTAGQVGLDPTTGDLVLGGISAETRQALMNIENVLKAAGSSLELVTKTTVFLRDMADFAEMNSVYSEFFREAPPARSTVQAGGLPKGAAVEIEAIAITSQSRGD
jgi:2-iminobutanoate/2-iminopropanoate deaminase